MTIFNDKYKHEIPYAKDYPFASDFYPKNDCRYPLTELYKSMVKERTGVAPHNCKISIPHMGKGIYNVYLYFLDIRQVFTPEEYNKFQSDMLMPDKESFFTLLFKDAIKQYPIEQLNGLRINPNGVFVEDFRKRSLAYTISMAEAKLKKMWSSKYPQIVYTTRWENSLYLFFNAIDALNQFAENNSAGFKKISYNIIKKYDKDGLCSVEALDFILDLQANYESIGGRNYFNSDAMNGLKII